MARIPVHIKALLDELEEAYVNRVTINDGAGGDLNRLDARYFEARESVERAIETYLNKRRKKLLNNKG